MDVCRRKPEGRLHVLGETAKRCDLTLALDVSQAAQKAKRRVVTGVRSGRQQHQPRCACREISDNRCAIGGGGQVMRFVYDQHVERAPRRATTARRHV